MMTAKSKREFAKVWHCQYCRGGDISLLPLPLPLLDSASPLRSDFYKVPNRYEQRSKRYRVLACTKLSFIFHPTYDLFNMPPALKRARTKSTTPSTTVSRAVQQAIATLASSSANLDPALFSQLLGSLHDAHAMALEQEGVVPKVEAREDEEGPRAIASPRVSPQPQPQAEEHSSSFSGRWWTRTVQFDDKTDEVVKRVLEDVEAALPKLDELVRFRQPSSVSQNTDVQLVVQGILLRPCCVEGKIDLMIWEFAIPGKAKTAWSGSLIKGTLAFPSGMHKYRLTFKLAVVCRVNSRADAASSSRLPQYAT